MESNFSQPQRQSSIGILVFFFADLQLYAKVFWPIFVFGLFKFDEIDKNYIFLGIAILLLIVGSIAYLKFINFTFYLDAEQEEFIINKGVFNKSKTVVQLHKIQQVTINQDLIQRLIGVYGVTVDTAGSTEKEGEIRAVSHSLALALKDNLLNIEKNKTILDLPNELDADSNSKTTDHPFIKISFLSLLKIGITSNYIRSFGLIVAFFWKIYEFGERFIKQSDFNKNQVNAYVNKGLAFESLFIILVLIVVAMFIAILMINLIRVIVKYFDFKITKQNGSLLLSYGLLNLKSTIVNPQKVQIITLSRNYFQMKMNILEIKIKQATSGEKEAKKNVIEIPGCNEQEREEILKLLFLKVPEKGVALKPNFRKLVFSLFLSIIVPLASFFAVANFLAPTFLDYAIFIPVYVLFVGLIVWFSFRNNCLFVTNDFIIKQNGAWDIESEIITPNKIQAISTSQLFWHKKADIGSIKIHTAGGTISFDLGNYTQIKQYVNFWLYQMETSDSNWM
jgi:putative membrane protein